MSATHELRKGPLGDVHNEHFTFYARSYKRSIADAEFPFYHTTKQKRRQISSTTTTKPQMLDNNPKCLTTTFTTVATSVEVWAMLAKSPQKHHHQNTTHYHKNTTTIPAQKTTPKHHQEAPQAPIFLRPPQKMELRTECFLEHVWEVAQIMHTRPKIYKSEANFTNGTGFGRGTRQRASFFAHRSNASSFLKAWARRGERKLKIRESMAFMWMTYPSKYVHQLKSEKVCRQILARFFFNLFQKFKNFKVFLLTNISSLHKKIFPFFLHTSSFHAYMFLFINTSFSFNNTFSFHLPFINTSSAHNKHLPLQIHLPCKKSATFHYKYVSIFEDSSLPWQESWVMNVSFFSHKN